MFCFAFVFSASAQKKLTILTIGDSNGTFEYSWPQQLKKSLPNSTVINKSISGNTIGFDNLDRAELNTVKNINRYLEEVFKEIGSPKNFDYVFINLGTNDTKRIFVDRQKEVPENMSLLIRLIRQYFTYPSLKKGFSEKTTDGVHLNERAQLQLSSAIINYLNHK